MSTLSLLAHSPSSERQEPENPSQTPSATAAALERDLAWLGRVIERRLAAAGSLALVAGEAPILEVDSRWAALVRRHGFGIDERLAMLLALAPHVRPQMLDGFFPQTDADRGRAEVGGLEGIHHGGFLPTGETLVFLLAGNELEARFACQHLFDRDHVFARHGLLHLDPPPQGEPRLAGRLRIGGDAVDLLTRGTVRPPDFGHDFPARLLRSHMSWNDLVLEPSTFEQLHELEAWLRHGPTLLHEWQLGRRIQPGYCCLFHGPSGTGKTLTATLLGQHLGRDVYRVALSAVVSKYVGDTEKNLERVFDRAARLGCVLFFDEADALFGKRTAVTDAHDRYANQEVAYLLQRIEDHAGVVILASNLATNLDEAFKRRFQAVVSFPMPGPVERRRLWASSFSPCSILGEGLDLDELARDYELSGGAIMNVVRYASLMALDSGTQTIRRDDVLTGVRRELRKDGKTL